MFEEGYKFTYQFQTAGPYTIPAKSGYEAAQITPIVGGSGWGMISAMRGGTGNPEPRQLGYHGEPVRQRDVRESVAYASVVLSIASLLMKTWQSVTCIELYAAPRLCTFTCTMPLLASVDNGCAKSISVNVPERQLLPTNENAYR